MCWCAYRKRDKEMRVVDKDIIVFKVMRKVAERIYSSYIMGYEYQCGKTYTINELKSHISKEGIMIIEDGFHSYSSKDCYVWSPFYSYGININKNGYGMIATYNKLYGTCVVECTIPKGSKYYHNYHGEIVSEKIIINREIPQNEWGEVE